VVPEFRRKPDTTRVRATRILTACLPPAQYRLATMRRRLAAISSADVAGYSRVMAHDEAATVQTLMHQRDLDELERLGLG